MSKGGTGSITPIIIGSTIAGVYLAAMASLLLPAIKQKLLSAPQDASVTSVVNSIKKCVADDLAWSTTVFDTANAQELRCSFDKKGCTDGEMVPNIRLTTLHVTGASSLCVPDYDPMKANQGLTAYGQPCLDFGSKECPYRIEVNWIPHCAKKGSTCKNPLEEVVVALRTEGPFAKAPAVVDISDGIERRRFPGQQTFNLIRGQESSETSIVVGEVMPSGTPGGHCHTDKSLFTSRRFNTVMYDPTGLALVDPKKSGAIYLGRGVYECTLSVPGFMVGRFEANLVDLKTKQVLIHASQEYSSGVAGYAQVRATGLGRFHVRTNALMVGLQQICEDEIKGPAEGQALALGVPAGFGVEVYSVMQCRVVREKS